MFKSKIKFLVITSTAFVLAVTAYLATDRYLIRHVEIETNFSNHPIQGNHAPNLFRIK